MALVFERIQTAGIARLSYLVGDDSAGVAAVIDPAMHFTHRVVWLRAAVPGGNYGIAFTDPYKPSA